LNKERITYLCRRYLDNAASEAELRELETILNDPSLDELVKAVIDNAYYDLIKSELAGPINAMAREKSFQAIVAQPQNKQKVTLWPRIAAAASIVFILSFGAYRLFHQTAPERLANNDVAPFSKQAILKTGHGKTLILNNNLKGTLAQYANIAIQKSKDEQLTYTNSNEKDEKAIFDTLQVPAGGRPYHLKLADGSAIIVNVASVLRFPENFRKTNNNIELIAGEAYFNIIHNAQSPLTIKAAHQTIEDVGTEFNVNTYEDEPDSRTTLVEGAVKVNNRTLVPGQQAIITAGSFTLATANILQVTAWKDGYFRFSGQHIQAVMRELARWYNIEVVYEGKPTNVGYFAKIARSKNISEVLKSLERTNSVHFKIEGRRVTVYSKK